MTTMRRIMGLALLALLLTAGAQAQGHLGPGGRLGGWGPNPTYGASGWLFGSSTGSEMAPAIAAANWTCGAGWDCSVAGTLNKNADGVGTAVPNPALTIVAGTTYRVSITVGAVTVASGATYTLGGTAGTHLRAAQTYTDYLTAATTANLIITPTPTGTRFTITAVSVTPVQPFGDAEVRGALRVRGTIAAPSLVLPNTDDGLGNYERIEHGWGGNVYRLNVTSGGAGQAREVIFSWNGVTGYAAASTTFYPAPTDTRTLGISTNLWKDIYLSRSIQGSKPKSLTDAGAAVSIERVAVPTNGYAGMLTSFTANSTDGTNRLTTTGLVSWAGADTAGTPTCGTPVVVGLSTAYKRANTLVCTFTTAVSTTNCDLQVTCTDNMAGVQTMTIEHFIVSMPAPNTYTPQ
jgi:hypothetical protein